MNLSSTTVLQHTLSNQLLTLSAIIVYLPHCDINTTVFSNTAALAVEHRTPRVRCWTSCATLGDSTAT